MVIKLRTAPGFGRALKYNSSHIRSHLRSHRYRQLRDLWLSVFGGGLLGSPSATAFAATSLPSAIILLSSHPFKRLVYNIL